MWSSLFGLEEKGVLLLRPDPSAKTSVAGFKSGTELRIAADVAGQTLQQLLEKLNLYRGPEQQIRRVWNAETGQELPLTHMIKGTVVAEVRATSIHI
jgi:hypothetical protein